MAKDTARCCDTIHEMEQDMGLRQPACCWGVCAALCGCWAVSSTLLFDETAAVPDSPQASANRRHSKAWQMYLPFQLGSKRKAEEQAAACSGSTGHIEVAASQAGTTQTGAGASRHGKLWRRVRQMFTLRSKSSSQHAGQATTSGLTVRTAGFGDDSLTAVQSDQHIAAMHTEQKLYVGPLPTGQHIAAVSSISQGHHVQQAPLVSSHSVMSWPDKGDTCSPNAALCHHDAAVQAPAGVLGTSESAE